MGVGRVVKKQVVGPAPQVASGTARLGWCSYRDWMESPQSCLGRSHTRRTVVLGEVSTGAWGGISVCPVL